MFFAYNSTVVKACCYVYFKVIMIETNFELLTSINVIRSSLLPTANVVPSGDQARLIFSPTKSNKQCIK